MKPIIRFGAVLTIMAMAGPPPEAAVTTVQVGPAITRAEVVVTDRNGRLVRNLNASDFTLLQNGEPQVLTDFRPMSIPVGNRDIEGAVGREPVDAATIEPGEDSRAFVILVDELHVSTAPDTRRRMELLVSDLLRAVTSDDDVAILAATEASRGYRLSRDLSAQAAALEQLKTDLRLETGRTDWNDDMIATLGAVGDAIDALTGTGHVRRTLVFVSKGIDLQMRASDPRLGPVMDALARVNRQARVAGVAIYSVDPRGSIGVGVSASDTAFVDRLVAGTGGRVFFNETDMRAVPRDLVDENGSFYVLEFRLAAAAQRQLSFGMKDSRLQARITFRPE